MAVDEFTGSGEVSQSDPPPPPEISIEGQNDSDPIITIDAGEQELNSISRFSTTDIFEALEFLTYLDLREYADELYEQVELFNQRQANSKTNRPHEGEQRAKQTLRSEPETGNSSEEYADSFAEQPQAEDFNEPPANELTITALDDAPDQSFDETPMTRATKEQLTFPDDELGQSMVDRADDSPKSQQSQEGPLSDKKKEPMTYDQFKDETTKFLDHDLDWYIFEWMSIPRLSELKRVPKGIAIVWDSLSDPEIIEKVKRPTWESITRNAKIGDLATRPKFRPKIGKIKLSLGSKGKKSGQKAGSQPRKPTTGYKKIKNVTRTKSYKRLGSKRVEGKAVISSKKPPKIKKPGSQKEGYKFQKKVADGKAVEFIGRLNRGLRRPDGKKVRKKVQIDDLKVADDGRLILIESKWSKPGIDIPDSGHRFGSKSKIDHMKRLIRLARENPNEINRIEIWVNKTGTGNNLSSTHGEIYQAIVAGLSKAEQKLISIKYL